MLEVSGITPAAQLPQKGTHGYYLYNSGNDLDLSSISVKLNATAGEFPDYQVICLLSTSVAEDATGNVVTKEPDWDVQFTYSFRNQVTTKNQGGTVAWDAVSMTTTIPTTDIATNWGTSWANLAQEQKIQWYVTNGSDVVQPLTTGTARQDDTWTINLSSPFSVTENVAVMTGQTSYNATSFEENWATWGAPVIYAPANMSFADVQDYKIICKIADDANAVALPNVVYTLTLTNDFAGQNKSSITTSTKQVKLSATTDTSKDIDITLPTGTKYARFYVLDGNGDAVDPTDATHQLTITGGKTYTDKTLGYYLYDAGGVSLTSISFSSSSANLDKYQVVMVTSAETAVLSGSDVQYEPDFETQTTYWFNYPATEWNTEANVEWSAQSMQIAAPDIETQKGSGYLEANKAHYTMQWYVVDKDGTVQSLQTGTIRVNDYWSVSINSNPFTLTNNIASVTNNAALSASNWAKWAAPTFYAPKNMTMREVAENGIKFVCKFYEEDETPLSDNLCAMTYTVYIDKQEKMGELKDGGKRGSTTITENLTSTTTSLPLDLTAATTAFASEVGGTPRYARIYLEKTDGTLIDPTTALTGVGGTAFTTLANGYWMYNESGITLPSDAVLKLDAGKYSYYHVVVCLSADAGESGHVNSSLARRPAPIVSSAYEPDYDFIYTIKFADTSSFPGTLSSTVITHSKELLLANESVTEATMSLSDYVNKIKSEYGVTSFANLVNPFHIRWYITKKNSEGVFEKIAGSESYLTPVASGHGHQTETDQGLYWNSVTQNSGITTFNESDVSKFLDVKISKPSATESWEDYKVVIVMSRDLTGQTDDGATPKKLTHEPDVLDMVYSYSFFVEDAFKFVHAKGESDRDYVTSSTDSRLAASVQQYSWDNSTSTKAAESGDFRQGVHTVEYDVYVDPSSSTPIDLHLPFQNYTGTGNNLEPAAYIRWYDWTTDINNSRLAKIGNKLADLTETNSGSSVSRGFFMLNNDEKGVQPTHSNVGVTFNPNGLTETVHIACDVSKYYDGIYTGTTGKYLMHEPTLSTRYVINIHPAAKIATAIQTGQTKLEAKGSDMFELAEDNGRVCVAINGTGTKFCVRANLARLSDYYIYNSSSSLVNCSKIEWYAYYQDESDTYRKTVVYNSTNRIGEITVSDLGGTYTSITDGSTTTTVTAGSGTRVHLVGFIGDGTTMAPAVHYEINLLEAPAYAIGGGNLPLERTEEYLRAHMTLQGTIDFDSGYGLPLTTSIDAQKENHSYTPMAWDEAQYGFCYPDVRRVWAAGHADYMGISPLHGDYILLRSMNKAGISPSETSGLNYYYHWWATTELYDYTYNYGIDNKGKYGTFLYVDASDESRTIAKMKVSGATLCAGSELCFTGAIANMTGGSVQPQVMTTVYAVKTNGTKTKVVSFHSSNLSTVAADAYTTGKWFQTYGRTTIPATIDLTNVSYYEVYIDNYSPGTDGADYAVDQLQFFTSNARLKVKQSGVNCGDVEVPLNLYVKAEDISQMAGKTMFWRICENNGAAMTNTTMYNNGGKAYGQTDVPATIPATLPTEASLTTGFSGYFLGNDGVTYFSLANKGFPLSEGDNYYISVYNLGETIVQYESLWGKPTDACSVFSPVFVPKMMYLSVEDASGNAVTTVTASCSTKEAVLDLKMVLNMPDDTEVSGFHKYTDVHYDYFNGTLAEFQDYRLTGDPSIYLQDAMRNFRGKGKTIALFNATYSDPPGTTYSNIAYATSAELPDAYKSVNSQKYYDVIKQAMDAGLLHLKCSSDIKLSVSSTKPTLTALPIEDEVTYNATSHQVCSPLTFTFTVNDSGGGPTIVLGFEDVTTYPSSAIRVIRVGKEQLDNLQKDGGFLLHIPVNTFKKDDSSTAKDGTLQILGNVELLAYKSGTDQTTDDQISANVDPVATFEETEITSSHMYISVNFHGTGVTKPAFREGFAYRLYFQFKDKDGGATACEGNAEFLLKVVPKYVTWKGVSNEWNSDANWKRSKRAELYKGIKDSETNTDGYEENGEGTLSTVSTTPDTYVPMKFTYVTLPTGLTAPNLVNLVYDADGIYNNTGTGATTNIQYDLMVRYTETTCQGGTNHTVVSGDIYDCEKFYGNWAKELYLKPGAELLNQQYLTYEKVWVEKELTANTWTLMATPLQNTYAGDMYVPYDAYTEANNGRQITEAFQPITFSTTANTAGFLYSRAKYPIYQKGWTQADCKVYTKTNDIRATEYSANIPGGVNTVLNQWSHQYNDVTVPYSTWTAFAIRAHRKDQTAKTLIRLPKADTSYDYYQWDNTSPTDGQLNQAVAKSTTGKLLTDGTADISGVTYGTAYGSTARTAGDGTISETIANVQSAYNYQLVGNPYLCSIDMAQFLAGNTANLETNGYWTYTNNSTGSPLKTGTVGPMQSFFVKAKGSATEIAFTPAMMVDGHSSADPASPARKKTLSLKAQNGRGQSEASIVTEEGENVETLFDSNLAEVPMVYTVADGQAVSINHVGELQTVCFGVTCTNEEAVNVTLSGMDCVEGSLYMVDAVTGETTEVGEGSTLTVTPNEYGRYFLTRSGDTTAMQEQLATGIRISVHNGTVSVTATQELGTVRVVSVGGATIYQETNCGPTAQFQLQHGVYIIETDGTAGQKTTKIFVK
ncbi:MAG: hypothetical protein K5764_05115 [Prevotella sp.]|nr:hypothetical protein [Prevotella sp.]